MKHGDFTELAKYYADRPSYSIELLSYIQCYTMKKVSGEGDFVVADIGAGTGKLTENLDSLGLHGYAIEPNEAMRQEGIKVFGDNGKFRWMEGAAENIPLPDECVCWALMGSSFHWADASLAVKEFHRILRPGGVFTAIWNPRNIKGSKLLQKIEDVIYEEIPSINRVSSGNKITTEEMYDKLCGAGLFESIVFMESPHVERMSKTRYMNIWRSVNDIQVQAGIEGFKRILDKIETIIKDLEIIEVPYLSRAWSVKVKK